MEARAERSRFAVLWHRERVVRLEIVAGEHVTESSLASGDRVLDACDDAGASIRFSCRSATCGICRVRIVEGSELVEPADKDELEVLARFGSSTDQRLACQLIVATDQGSLRIESASPFDESR